MIVETLKCDVCGKLRVNDSNHWLEGSMLPAAGQQVIRLAPVGLLKADQTVHLCGQECAMKWLGNKIGEL